jgi:hypothetical protein
MYTYISDIYMYTYMSHRCIHIGSHICHICVYTVMPAICLTCVYTFICILIRHIYGHIYRVTCRVTYMSHTHTHNTHTNTHTHTHTQHTHKHTHTHTHIYIYIYTYIYMYICMYVYIYIHTVMPAIRRESPKYI